MDSYYRVDRRRQAFFRGAGTGCSEWICSSSTNYSRLGRKSPATTLLIGALTGKGASTLMDAPPSEANTGSVRKIVGTALLALAAAIAASQFRVQ